MKASPEKTLVRVFAATLAVCLLGTGPGVKAATLLNDDFTTMTAGSTVPFTTTAGFASWSLATVGGQTNLQLASTSGGQSTASTTFSGVNSASVSSFTLSTEFTLTQNTANGSNYNYAGLGFLGASSSFASNSLVADVAFTGTGVGARIFSRDSSGTASFILGSSTALASTGIAGSATDLWSLSVTGTYVGSSLDLQLTIQDLSLTSNNTYTSPVETISASAFTGTNFGLRDQLTGTTNLDYTNLTVTTTAVPEPPVALLLGLALLPLWRLRMRRA